MIYQRFARSLAFMAGLSLAALPFQSQAIVTQQMPLWRNIERLQSRAVDNILSGRVRMPENWTIPPSCHAAQLSPQMGAGLCPITQSTTRDVRFGRYYRLRSQKTFGFVL